MQISRDRTVFRTTIVICALIILSLSSPTFADDGQRDTSRQISTCAFRVSFDTNSFSLSQSDRAVVAEALRQERQRRSGTIGVSAHWSNRESYRIVEQRVAVVAAELMSLGASQAEVEPHSVSSDDIPSDAGAYLVICSRADELERKPIPTPSEPDRLVHFAVGAARLAIPLRYLDPSYWRDIPFESVKMPAVGMILEWPTFNDSQWLADHGCGTPWQRSCQTRMIQIILKSPKAFSSDAISALQAYALGYIPVAGDVFHTRVFVEPRGRISAAFLATDETGRKFFGVCSLEASISGDDAPTAEDMMEKLDENVLCTISDVPVAAGLNADVTFSASHFSNWRTIITEMRRFVPRFVASQQP